MKQIFKNLLLIFIGLCGSYNGPVQGSAAAAVGAVKAATPIIEEAAKVAPSFFALCGQKIGAAAMKHVVRPAFILGRTITVTSLTALGVYGGGKVILEHNGYVPARAPVPHVPAQPAAKEGAGLFGGVFNHWVPNPPAAPKKSSWEWPGLNDLPGINSLKNSNIGKWMTQNLTPSKVVLGYCAAGYAYIHILKRLQLTTLHRKFFSGINAAQNGRATDPTWVECQTILTNSGRGYGAAPTVQNAFDYINNLSASDIDNGWVDWIFGPHVLWSKALRNDKMLWLF